jgi:hypothetical protein
VPEHIPTESEIAQTAAPEHVPEHIPTESETGQTVVPVHVPEHIPTESEISQTKVEQKPEHIPSVESGIDHAEFPIQKPEQKPEHIPSVESGIDHAEFPIQKPEQKPEEPEMDVTHSHVPADIEHVTAPTVKPISGSVTSEDHTVSSIEHGIIPGDGNYSAPETTKSPLTIVTDHVTTNITGASITTESYPHVGTGGFHFTTAQIIPSEKPATEDHHFSTEEPYEHIPSGEPNIPSTGSAYLPPSSDGLDDEDENGEPAAFGPGTCRYGGKVYVSAQQIPRDDPCDFCFCFRSDIICLQQSCPPPIPGCHEEPIQGFCCPRYECPVSMATSVNVTTTTTTTTTTLPPHFFSHAYKGSASRTGCQIKGQAYRVGEIVRSASGPCLSCR